MSNFHDVSVLVVDDEEIFRKVVVEVTKEMVATVYEAGNGHDALTVFEKNRIDIAILDINMPKMNGIELLKKIHKNYPNTVCIMLTGGFDKKQIVEIIKNNAFDFLEKPFDAEVFNHHLSRAIHYQKRNFLLKEAAKEFLFTMNNMDLEKFDKLTIEEQTNALEAGLAILKFKSLKKKKSE